MSSSTCVNVWPEESIRKDDAQVLSCVVEDPKGRRQLWYEIHSDAPYVPTVDLDSFAIATIFIAMQTGGTLKIHGAASPQLLSNLEEFSHVWHRWKPNRYRPVEIWASKEQEQAADSQVAYISAFSGGLDSVFTLYRHAKARCVRQQRPIKAAAMVHGFDIPLEQIEEWQNASHNSKIMCNDLGVEFLTVRTNWRQLGINWEDGHGAGLASVLTLFADHFKGGLIATSPYDFLQPGGNNALTQPMFSSGRFEIIGDGGGFTRFNKVALISEWEEGCRHLRVCWEGPKKDRNCCICEKCIRTILNFRVVKGSLPECFKRDVTPAQIKSIRIHNDTIAFHLQNILNLARSSGTASEDWVRALEKRLFRYRSSKMLRSLRDFTGQTFQQIFSSRN